MSSKSYSKKRQDPRWQKKRLEVLERDHFACKECASETNTLHVHHPYYVSGRDPWEYPASVLETLCEECHDKKHQEDVERMGGMAPFESWEYEIGSFADINRELVDHESGAVHNEFRIALLEISKSSGWSMCEAYRAITDAANDGFFTNEKLSEVRRFADTKQRVREVRARIGNSQPVP